MGVKIQLIWAWGINTGGQILTQVRAFSRRGEWGGGGAVCRTRKGVYCRVDCRGAKLRVFVGLLNRSDMFNTSDLSHPVFMVH